MSRSTISTFQLFAMYPDEKSCSHPNTRLEWGLSRIGDSRPLATGVAFADDSAQG